MHTVNEDLIMRSLVAAHGQAVAQIMFSNARDAAIAQAAEYDAIEAQIAQVGRDLEALPSTLPPIQPLQDAADRLHAEWLEACAAIERRRTQGQSAEVPLRNRLAELRGRRVAILSSSRPGGWAKSNALAHEKVYEESLIDQSLRLQAQAQGGADPRH
jgi:hypothetical protein